MAKSDKKKAYYVNKACVHCKASHVACDAQRPCKRCIRRGTEATCVDAESKKRGRPKNSANSKRSYVLNSLESSNSTVVNEPLLIPNIMDINDYAQNGHLFDVSDVSKLCQDYLFNTTENGHVEHVSDDVIRAVNALNNMLGKRFYKFFDFIDANNQG